MTRKDTTSSAMGDGSESAAADAEFAFSKASEDCAVFPPSKHENLHPLPTPVPSLSTLSSSSSASNFFQSPPSSSSSASSSYSDAEGEEEEEYDDPCAPKPPIQVTVPGLILPGWLRIGIGLIRSKVLGVFRSVVAIDGKRRVFWSIGAFAAVAAWIWWLYVRIRFRRRWMRMVWIIREQDEKIKQLLHQIAQMNEVLLAKHKDLASRLPN
ncbi:hypothetical protein MLD38_021818 [Melastoma candidum]|uniref:Uncharacterized protein n=1 Tax=Melastoma candidum TaxID=119954 RepID=A0ACB9QK76_9MYRT|nr:hypothetical protein MLD38_021818 [Melastoma candidum]